jgi:hypothetical protein
MANTPGALQLRLLETIVEVAAEKNSTLVLPFPVELLRFLEHNSSAPTARATEPVKPEAAQVQVPPQVPVPAPAHVTSLTNGNGITTPAP